MTAPTPLHAIDAAIAAVRRLQEDGLRTSGGDSADAQLDRLLSELTARRHEVAAGGPVDRAWVGATVRWVAEWLPEDELPLLARLGVIARLSPRS